MRNPNYRYEPSAEGWYVFAADGTTFFGKTKAAARSRLLRVMRQRIKDGKLPEYTGLEESDGGETNG
jgi:hypothetical protein